MGWSTRMVPWSVVKIMRPPISAIASIISFEWTVLKPRVGQTPVRRFVVGQFFDDFHL